MKIKNLFLAAAAIVVGFSSCSKDDGGNDATEKNIFIQIEQPSLARADVGDIAAGEYSEISYGHLYFTTATDEVKRYIRVTNTAATGTISPNVLKGGTIIESLSADITKVYFYANMFGEASHPISNISDLDNQIITLKSQYDANYGISNAVVKGSGTIISAPSTANWDWEAIFEVSPMLARLETAKVTSDATEGPRTARLEGIYINNYHPDLSATD